MRGRRARRPQTILPETMLPETTLKETPMTRDEIADTAKSTTASVAGSLKEGGRSALADVRHRATDAASRATGAARAEAMDRAESAKATLAEEGGRLAQTLRQASDDGDDSIQARVMSVAADSVDEITANLRDRSLNDLVGDVGAFARRNPGAFVAAAALAGFALARFARASTPQPDSGPGYGSDYDPTRPAVSQGYSTMPPASGVETYGSPKPTGSGYGSGEGASFGSPSYAGSSMSTPGVSTHGMTTGSTGGDPMGADAMSTDTMGAPDADRTGMRTMAEDDLADEDTPNRNASSSAGLPS